MCNRSGSVRRGFSVIALRGGCGAENIIGIASVAGCIVVGGNFEGTAFIVGSQLVVSHESVIRSAEWCAGVNVGGAVYGRISVFGCFGGDAVPDV